MNSFQLHARLRWTDSPVRPEVRPQLAIGQQPVVETHEAAFELELGEQPFRLAVLWQ